MDQKKTLTVKEWADDDKPRERLLNHGKKTLSNAELIAILLRTGVPGKSVVEVAQEVLASADNRLTILSRMDARQLSSHKGMASAKVATLMAALELGWRMQGELEDAKEVIIGNSQDLFRYMSPLLADLDHEEFWVVELNNRKKVIGRQRIAMGGQTSTAVDLRCLFRAALESKAVSVMVAHNHPSGSLRPSREDRCLTQSIKEAGDLLDIKLLDHLIVALAPTGQADYYSFHDNGAL